MKVDSAIYQRLDLVAVGDVCLLDSPRIKANFARQGFETLNATRTEYDVGPCLREVTRGFSTETTTGTRNYNDLVFNA